MKLCYKCKQTKPLSEFTKNKKHKDGVRKECKSCVANWCASIPGKSSRLFSSCKRRAKISGGIVTIDKDWIDKKLIEGVCELTKLPFNFSNRGNFTRQPYAPSIDKKDAKNPDYTPENSRLVLWAVNCAMSEYGMDIMLPILKKIIENAKQNTATSVSEGDYIQGAVGAELGSVSTPWTWEDYDRTDDYSGATRGENAYHSAKEGGGDGVGCGSEEVGPPQTPQSKQDNGISYGKIVSYEELCRHIFDKP
jgi:hypothetical protein